MSSSKNINPNEVQATRVRISSNPEEIKIQHELRIVHAKHSDVVSLPEIEDKPRSGYERKIPGMGVFLYWWFDEDLKKPEEQR